MKAKNSLVYLPITIYKIGSKTHVVQILNGCPCICGKANPLLSKGFFQLLCLIQKHPKASFGHCYAARDWMEPRLGNRHKPSKTKSLHKPKR